MDRLGMQKGVVTLDQEPDGADHGLITVRDHEELLKESSQLIPGESCLLPQAFEGLEILGVCPAGVEEAGIHGSKLGFEPPV
jgi:hypothetical protein